MNAITFPKKELIVEMITKVNPPIIPLTTMLEFFKIPDTSAPDFLHFLDTIDDICRSKLNPLWFELARTDNLIEDLIDDFSDYLAMAERFYERHPFFYDKNKMWWLWSWNLSCWEMVDETDIMNIIDMAVKFKKSTIETKVKTEILESMRRIGRKKIPKTTNPNWVQFGKKIVDIMSGEVFDASPEYFLTNPLPFSIGETEETPMMDKIFREWVSEDYVNTLYQIIAYSMIPAYPIHRAFCLIGAGMNGKSKFLELLTKFIGIKNCCSTDLDSLLESRFESAKLFKKLVCLMGETNLTAVKKTQRIKRLTGGDMVGFEFKNKTPFEDVNYAKIIMATNSLPVTLDKTIGFYRRWFIIDFPNQFTEEKDILLDIPEKEYFNLAKKCIRILKELLEARAFNKEGDVEERKQRYEDLSNPLMKFIKEKCVRDVNGEIIMTEFTHDMGLWLADNGYRHMSPEEIGRQLTNEGFERRMKHSGKDKERISYRVICGIKWIGDDTSGTDGTVDTDTPTLFPYIEK